MVVMSHTVVKQNTKVVRFFVCFNTTFLINGMNEVVRQETIHNGRWRGDVVPVLSLPTDP
jgi:hypothetical protein